MKVEDVMTRDVLTIGPEASIRDVAMILVENGVSGLPVCDAERRVLGVVSEGDILFKEHDPASRKRGGTLARLLDPTNAKALVKSHARTAGEAMSAPAITIGPYRPVGAAARLMVEHGVNRLPVVKGEELVGIVTRADLVRAFTRPDEEIAREIGTEVLERTLWLDPGAVDVEVRRGHVTLAGSLETRTDAQLLERLTARVPGVVAVSAALTWSVDDTGRKAKRAVGAR